MTSRIDRTDAFYRDIYLPSYKEAAAAIGIPRSDAADVLLMAIAGQESDWRHRWQVLNSGNKGPARGFWQFEKGGGVEGVLTHPRTRAKAWALCEKRGVPPRRDEVWPSLENDDVLAVGFARLLLWSDPRPLPRGQHDAWKYYLDNWRPGKPHATRWPENWAIAKDVVAVRPLPPVIPAPHAENPSAPVSPEVIEMSNEETVRITLEHDDAEGNRLSTLHLTYPTMDNATANRLQLDFVEEMLKVLRGYSRDKAKDLGLKWPEG